MLDKVVRLNQLYDWYSPLLTDKQRDVFELYYHHNLSLAEIAENHGISRSAVRDALLRTEKRLETFENKLGLAEKQAKSEEIIENMQQNRLLLGPEELDRKTQEIIHKLQEMLNVVNDVWTSEENRRGS